MELILIADGRLKVALTAEDMKSCGLDCDKLDYDNGETRRVFRDILERAKVETGFDAASDRVFIQVYPSKSGGCELFVTRLGTTGAAAETRPALSPAKTARRRIFAFDGKNALASVCRELSAAGYSGESAAYSAGEKFYLSLVCDCGRGYSALSFIDEFGEELTGFAADAYLAEYCKAEFAENAVAHISNI